MSKPPLFESERQRTVVEAMAELVYCNPFLSRRLELEKQVLGKAFTPFFKVWHPRIDIEDDNPNVLRIGEEAERLAEQLRDRLKNGARCSTDDRRLYHELCLYVLYYRVQDRFFDLITRPDDTTHRTGAPFYSEFRKVFDRLLGVDFVKYPADQPPEHLFACFFQIRRAFQFTFRAIAGGSMPAADLRARVWQSIFSHDIRRYQRVLYRRMGEFTTLITGPTGAGKELVARAIGLSRYIPFDPKSRRFRESFEDSFFPVNLSALSPTLIESELFGHKKGAFTGAIADRKGRLQQCPPLGTVFLDEIGEVNADIQVKLLRVLEERTFQPLGTTDQLSFEGKVVAATNRDLDREMRAGRFRQDLYFRLCADTLVAPSLQERVADSPEELSMLIHILAQRVVGEREAAEVAREAERWIDRRLGPDYAWPGNVRELSQCVSNLLIHRDYRPIVTGEADAGSTAESNAESTPNQPTDWERRLQQGRLTADELLRGYCRKVHGLTGSYVETARVLGIDRRTVKSKLES